MEFEAWYLRVVRSDTSGGEEMDDCKWHLDHSLNRLDYNRLNRAKMRRLVRRHSLGEPNLCREVVEAVDDWILKG